MTGSGSCMRMTVWAFPLRRESIFIRGKGKNTGLGLFLIREILSITGIMIHENGIVGRGARFEITVPDVRFRTKAISACE